jgi:hypothetical protein
MQRLLPVLAFCAFFPFRILNAQDYSSNRWKETSRLNPFDQEVDYTDTVFLLSTDRNVMDVVIGGYAYRGTINGDSLDIRKRTFEVVKNEPGEIRLRFKKLTHVFTRELKGQAAADAEAVAAQNAIPANPVKKISLRPLYGTWKVYKKVPREGISVDIRKMQYIKMLQVFRKAQQGKKGILTSSSNLVMAIKDIKGPEIRYLTTLQQPKSLKVLKQNATELLLEDENHMVYFLKKW